LKLVLPAPHRLRVVHGVAVALGCALLLAGLAQLAAFELLDLRFNDWRYRLRGPVPASPRIALVEVDDATIAAYGSWPLPREAYAILIAALNDAGASAVGIDLLFLGESPANSLGDELLAASTRAATRLVHAIAFLPEDATLGGGDATPAGAQEALVLHGRPVGAQKLPLAVRVSLPYQKLLEASDALGHTAVSVDRDGVVRRIPQFVRYRDFAFPSLAIRVVETAARSDSTFPQIELSEDAALFHRHGRRPTRIPTDAGGSTAIVFAGGRESFPNTVSLLQVLQWYRDGDSTSLKRAFENRLVLVGTTAVGEVATDIGATPVSAALPLVYIHANAVNSVIQGRFLSRPPTPALIAFLAGFAILLGVAFSVLTLPVSAALVAVSVLVVAVLDHVLFQLRSVDLPPTAALLLPPLTWIAVEGYRRVVTERRTRARDRELEVARSIQRHLLPSGTPEVAGFDVYGLNLPATEVGGDYFDWIPLDGRGLAVALGDVTGHGVPAALLMSHLRASFHAEARPGTGECAITVAMNRSLARAAQAGRFATFFLVRFDREGGVLRYCNAGHNPPLLVRAGAIEELMATGLPLGMIEDTDYTEESRAFAPGDTLVIYSDGVTEAPNARDQEYGEERLQRKVLELLGQGAGARRLVEGILEDVRAFARDRLSTDDVTIVVVRRT